jgi:hypothetical protein
MGKPKPRDPVIGALIGKLPAPGTTWPRADRVAWLRQMAMAFDSAFGAEAPIGMDVRDLASAAIDWSKARGALADRHAGQPYNEEFSVGRPVDVQTDKPALRVVPQPKRYSIDPQGFAVCDGRPIAPEDVPPDATLFDERVPPEQGDLSTVYWKGEGVRIPERLPASLRVTAA